MNYLTRDGTARAGEDYVGRLATLSFEPGETRKRVAISLLNVGHRPWAVTFEFALRPVNDSTPVSGPAKLCVAGKLPFLPGDLKVRRLGNGRAIIGFTSTLLSENAQPATFELQASDELRAWKQVGDVGRNEQWGWIPSVWTWTDLDASTSKTRYYRVVAQATDVRTGLAAAQRTLE